MDCTGDALKEQILALQSVFAVKPGETGAVFSCVAGGLAAATVAVDALSDRAVRFRWTLDGAHEEDDAPQPLAPAPGVRPAVDEDGRGLRLALPHLTVEVTYDPWRVVFKDARGSVLTEQLPRDVDASGTRLAPPPGFRVVGDDVQPFRRCTGITETLRILAGDHFYGLGERFTSFDHLGRTVKLRQENALGARTGRSYKNVPLLISPRGYGLFVNSSRVLTFHLGTLSGRSYTVETDGAGLEYVFIAGTPAEILAEYTRLLGRSPIPPRWSFGLWASTGFVPLTQQGVEERAARLREERIPCDVLHLDSFWEKPRGWNDLTWDGDAFPDPQAMMARLRAAGYRVCLWENPYVSVHSPLFAEGRQKGFFVRRVDGSVLLERVWRVADAGLCAIVDFTNPEAVRWFQEKHEPLLQMGVDTFKTDFGEEIPEDALFHNGKTGKAMRNAFAALYQEAVYRCLEQARGEAVIWARSGGAGAHRYPAHWSGDPQSTFEDMAATLRAGLSAAMSGFSFWSHDIGGFDGTPTPELFARWAQFGLLSPMSRYHGRSLRDPWLFGDEVLRIFRRYTQLRYRLLPYLYSTAVETEEQGLPVLRPMVLVFPEDPATYTVDSQFMLGDRLLVAPVLNEEGRVSAYLPAGGWRDLLTGEEARGPGYLRKVAPLDELPILVREDAIIPMAPDRPYATAEDVKDVGFLVNVTRESRATYRWGALHGTVSCTRGASSLVFRAEPGLAGAHVRFLGVPAPGRVAADGADLPRVAREEALEIGHGGWWLEDGQVVVRTAASTVRLDVEWT